MKELTSTYGGLLQDKRVRAEQSKYESLNRQRNAVMTRYRKVYQAFIDLKAGLRRAQQFYNELKETVDSLEKNVETFVNNRRSEGAQLLNQIEKDRTESASSQAERERERLRELMERMSMEPSSPSRANQTLNRPPVLASSYQNNAYPPTSPPTMSRYPAAHSTGQYNGPTSPSSMPLQAQPSHAQHYSTQNGAYQGSSHVPRRESQPSTMHDPYVPSSFGRRDSNQASVLPPSAGQFFSGHPGQYDYPQSSNQYMPSGYVPPPPPPGPPPLRPQQTFPNGTEPYTGGPSIYPQSPPAGQRGPAQSQQAQTGDPWTGLNAWR